MAAPRKKWGALNWTLNLNKLISEFKHAIPRRSGKAARSLKLKNVKGSMKTSLVLTMAGPPYLRILDVGGKIPARRAHHPRKAMKFTGRDGKTYFRGKVRGFHCRARNWVRIGFRKFWAKGKFGGKMPLNVGWAA